MHPMTSLVLLASCAAAAPGCVNQHLSNTTMVCLDQRIVAILDQANGNSTLAGVAGDLRTVLNDVQEGPEAEREVLFERLPQGMRALSGIRRTDRTYLRRGVMTIHVATSMSVNVDNSYGDLERTLHALEQVRSCTQQPDRVQTLYRDGQLPQAAGMEAEPRRRELHAPRVPEEAVRLRVEPADLYTTLAEALRQRTPPHAVYVLALHLPYVSGTDQGDPEQRVAVYGGWFRQDRAGEEPVLQGWDHMDVDAHNASLGIDYADTNLVAAPLRWIWTGVSNVNEALFQDQPWAWPVNLVVNVGANSVIAVKECALEVAKTPLAFFASFLAPTEATVSRAGRSALECLTRCDDVLRHHWLQARAHAHRTSWLSHAWSVLGLVPIAGPYFHDYLNDPWSSYPEAPPRPNFVSLEAFEGAGTRGGGAPAAPHTHIFVSRGVNGADRDHGGNEVWLRFLDRSLADARVSRCGAVQDAPYAWGTAIDPLFSLVNLSSGYAYEMANEVARRLEACGCAGGDDPLDGVVLLAHSGGVQRATVASRLLWERNIFTQRIFGAAGPALGPAPTKPGAYGIVLNLGEFRRADITSQISRVAAAVERAVLWPLEIPVIGPVWLFSAPANGAYRPVLNCDVYRTGDGESFTHQNPGTVRPHHRDPSLSYFTAEIGHVIRADQVLQQAYLEAVQKPRMEPLRAWQRGLIRK